MTLCEQCGSIRIVRAPSTPLDRVLAVLTGKRPFLCRRCGWRGRRNWTDKDLRKLQDYGAGGAETDPALSVLDTEQSRQRRLARASGSRVEAIPIGAPDSKEAFDVGALNFTGDATSAVKRHVDEQQPLQRDRSRHRRRRSRRKPRGRRAIAAAIGATALIIFLFLILSVIGGCGAGLQGIS